MLDLIFTIVTSPLIGFCQLKQQHLPWKATILVILAQVANTLQDSPLLGGSALMVSVLGGSILAVILTLIMSLVLHWIAKFFHGRSQFSQTYQAVAFSSIPLIFAGPLILLRLLFPFSQQFASMSVIVNLLLMIWVIVLLVIAIRQTHEVSTVKAIFIAILPLAILLSLLFLLLVLAGVVGIGLL